MTVKSRTIEILVIRVPGVLNVYSERSVRSRMITIVVGEKSGKVKALYIDSSVSTALVGEYVQITSYAELDNAYPYDTYLSIDLHLVDPTGNERVYYSTVRIPANSTKSNEAKWTVQLNKEGTWKAYTECPDMPVRVYPGV